MGALRCLGAKPAAISQMIGIRSAKTLRKHFRADVDRGGLEANSPVAQTLYRTPVKHFVATMLWLKCGAHWRERGILKTGLVAVAPFIVALEREK